jgi:hypothetical protein
MVKQLSDLAKDLRAGLELGLEKATHDLVIELKERGPYWTGDFEAAWRVVPGQKLMASNQAGTSLRDVNFEEPNSRTTTAVAVPLPEIEQGYTVYNDMVYADIAMDLEPSPDGKYRHERANSTADRDWFENYLLGGVADRTLALGMKQGMGLAGFRR